jgi:hypothetical protein
MKVEGPDHYHMVFDTRSYKVRSPSGMPHFVGRAAAKGPKLYVVSSRGQPVYVGVTRQAMSSRLHYGWKAQGRGGYHGYAWRRELLQADLDIWYDLDPAEANPALDLETIEAEVVFLLRQAKQWPKYQTEIHFHASDKRHRTVAGHILGHYSRNRQQGQ